MDSISTAILAISLIIIMLGMGLSLTVKDFTAVFVRPKAIFIGLFSQLIILPVIGFSLINVFELSDNIAVGVIILAACPGGPTSNLITHLAKGDLALSVSLTAISSLLTLISIPFIINLGLQQVLGEGTVIQLNVIQTVAQILIIVIIPVGIGMLLNAKKHEFALKMLEPVRKASAVVFILVVVGIIIKERSTIITHFEQAGLVTLTLNLLTMAVGFMLGYLGQLNLRQRVSIAIESGIQNGTLGISIATVLLSNTGYAVSSAVYGLIMFLTAGIFIFWANKQIKT
ncbi:MAG: bile acid:sodium symporter family protein [Bacteroidota bacterium]